MQVAHVHDRVTHAVIGRSAAQSFGISDDAAFFEILSNSLYSNKILAVVRETLCNAWDAHISAGRTSQAIEITLNDKELIIRDFGKGIPKDKMHPIYCVYGASTKLNDGHQTGGFGLGCKAPFAYVDHFEVTSNHENVRTIYRISKSNAEVGGKPGLIEILSIPTTETGIQVKIAVADRNDRYKFESYIEKIVNFGEMKASLNGKLLDTIPFSEANSGFVFTTHTLPEHSGKLFVRYGNVVYPVPDHDEYRVQHNSALKRLEPIGGYGAYYSLILQAPPNSISVTPSRESLSMSEQTVGTLKQILTNFCDTMDGRVDAALDASNKTQIDNVHLAMRPGSLLSEHSTVAGYGLNFRKPIHEPKVILNVANYSAHCLRAGYPKGLKFRHRDIRARLNSLLQTGFGDRGKIQSFLADLPNENQSLERHRTDWFSKRIVAPLITKILQEPLLETNRLLVWGQHHGRVVSGDKFRFVSGYNGPSFYPAATFKKETLLGYLPFLRNAIVLSHSRLDVSERLPSFPEMRWFGESTDMLVYVVPRSEPRLEAARAFFQKRGLWVIDLTKRRSWEPAPEPKTKRESVPKKPKRLGIPTLSNLLDPESHKAFSTAYLSRLEEPELIEKPEFVVKLSSRTEHIHTLPGFYEPESRMFAILYGKRGGVVINERQYTKYTSDGAIGFSKFMLQEVCREMTTNPRIAAYLAVSPDRASVITSQARILEAILEDYALSTYFDVSAPITPEDSMHLHLWKRITDYRYFEDQDLVKQTKAALSKIRWTPSMAKLSSTVSTSQLVPLLSGIDISILLKSTRITEEKKSRVRDILIHALKP